MLSNMGSIQEALRNNEKQVEFLQSEENAEYMWAYFGKLLDRVYSHTDCSFVLNVLVKNEHISLKVVVEH